MKYTIRIRNPDDYLKTLLEDGDFTSTNGEFLPWSIGFLEHDTLIQMLVEADEVGLADFRVVAERHAESIQISILPQNHQTSRAVAQVHTTCSSCQGAIPYRTNFVWVRHSEGSYVLHPKCYEEALVGLISTGGGVNGGQGAVKDTPQEPAMAYSIYLRFPKPTLAAALTDFLIYHQDTKVEDKLISGHAAAILVQTTEADLPRLLEVLGKQAGSVSFGPRTTLNPM